MTEVVEEQFASSPLIFGANEIGEDLQQSAVNLAWDFLHLKPLDPRWLTQTASTAVQDSCDIARALTPGDNLTSTWEVLRNTFGVINLVNRAPAMLQLPAGNFDLHAALDRAYATGGDYAAIWLIEGLGAEYANRNWPAERPVRGLLTSGQGAQLPAQCLLMMHAGMGISFARRTVRPLTPYAAASDIDAALARFLSLVKSNARPGYAGPAFESLGLVTRTWFQQMVPAINAGLWRLDREALEYFWHGVGRAIYFDPRYLLPGTTAFHGVEREAEHELGLLNATAGAAWAFNLVNIRQPEATLNLLRQHSAMLSRNGAFTNGLISTMLMASDMLPGDPNTRAFCQYQPPPGDAALADVWRRMVHAPCEAALREYYPVLKRSDRLGEIFRYQDLRESVRRMGGVF